MKPFVIVVDLDGTLCNASHRDHLAVAGQWDEFHSKLMDDEPWPDVKAFLDLFWTVNSVTEDFVIVGLTGRNEQWRGKTLEWFSKHELFMDELLMRPDKDFTPDAELKPRMLLERFPQESILFILEDRDKVVDAWRNAGFNCWQVRPGGY
jgi:FMN phosphatase YigB (HAD superfamily)